MADSRVVSQPFDEATVERCARAGQKLALDWGHQPWSDSWAELVAKTVLAAALVPDKEEVEDG